MLLDVYWIMLYWWSRATRSHLQLSKRDFSSVGFFWWLLVLYFVAVLTFLLSEVSRKYNVIFGGAVSTSDSSTNGHGGDGKVDVILIRTAVVSMLLYLYFCIAVFLVIKLEGIVAKRWNWKRQGRGSFSTV